jgi:5-methylcytosine-specific restriction protein A
VPSAEDFKLRLDLIFTLAQQNGLLEVEVTSVDLHRRVGDYPGPNHRMPLCCQVMKQYLTEEAGDEIVETPPSGQGDTLRIRYVLPRPRT